jgi:tRNA nucleotidyltransferase (CCA-adding enzyme)
MDLESILKSIYPDKNQIDCLSGIVSKMGNILQNGSSFLKVKKVTPAGSLARNTILKGHLEVDCVYILEHNGYSFSHNYFEVINTLRKNLPNNIQYEQKPHSIHFNLERPIGTIAVDLLPAFEISLEQITAVKNRDAYYGSTALIQKKYFAKIKKVYPRFTDLVRLLKQWKKIQNIPALTSYMLELIAANGIYRTTSRDDFVFCFEACFRTIQSFTDGQVVFPVFWEKYVDNSEFENMYSQNGLWIIDPSDLSENIAQSISQTEKEIIKSEAGKVITSIRNENYSFFYE